MKYILKVIGQLTMLVTISVIAHYTVYYRFTPNYVPRIFSESGFKEMYEQSVFRYRIIGTKLQLSIYEGLRKAKLDLKENEIYNKRLTALDINADPLFYASYFIINCISCIIMAILFFLIYNYRGLYKLNENEKIFTILFLILIIGLTQFVLTPYDNLSYASLALAFYSFLIHEQVQSRLTYVLLSITVLIATLVRESSIIVLCAIASIYITHIGLNFKLLFKKLWLPCLAYISAYIGIRYYAGGDIDILQSLTFLENVSGFKSISKLIAVLFGLSLFYLLWQYAEGENRPLFKTFLLLSIPYFVMVMLAGLIIEFRLWVPLIIGTLLLCKLNTRKLLSSSEIAIQLP